MSKPKVKKKYYCSICSSEITIFGFGYCFHPVCYRCFAKSRVVEGDEQCPICGVFLEKVLFTKNLSRVETFDTSHFIKLEDYGLWCETKEIKDKIRELLLHKCTVAGCDKVYEDFLDLRQHMRQQHQKYFCEICVRNEKVFTYERKTYSHNIEQTQHYRKLSSNSELWDHSMKMHFVCEHPLCVHLTKCVFSTREEIEKHTSVWHGIKIGKTIPNRSFSDVIQSNDKSNGIGASSSPWSKTSFQSAREIKGEGKIVSVDKHFGFIERDDFDGVSSENVYFNIGSYGCKFNDDLTKYLNIGQRVSFHARLHPHENSSKWRAITVTDATSDSYSDLSSNADELSEINQPVSNRNLEYDNAIVNCAIRPKKGLQNGFTAYNGLTGIGRVHCNLGPTFGFIIREGEDGKSHRENVYFDLRSYSAGMRNKIFDLTKELKINEMVGYELQDPNIIKRPKEKQYRAVRVWKCSKNLSLNSIKSMPTKLSIVPKEKESVNRLEEFSKNFYVVADSHSSTSDESVEDNTHDYTSLKLTTDTNVEDLPNCSESAGTKNSLNDGVKIVQQASIIEQASELTSDKYSQDEPCCSKSEDLIEDSKKQQDFTPTDNLKIVQQASSTEQASELIPDKYSQDEPCCSKSEDLMEHSSKQQDFTPTASNNNDDRKTKEVFLFRHVLVLLLGRDNAEALTDFSIELKNNNLSLDQVAFVYFTVKKSPKVYFVLMEKGGGLPTSKNKSFLHRSFVIPDTLGFNAAGIDELFNSKLAAHQADSGVLFIKNSSIYLIFLKDDLGNVKEIYLHTNFYFI